jgi:glycosyltransferase involved in cell wall biosynthesis
MRKIIYKRAEIVVALNEESGQWLREHTSTRNVWVVPNAIVWPIKRMDPHIEADSLPLGRKFFLGVGRLDHLKGFDRLIRSFSLISGKLPEWDLVIVGQGVDHDSLYELSHSLGLESRVIFMGLAGNIVDWYQRCDVFVLSSNVEGFPVALLEAMACGMPVVSVDCTTGPRDIIVDGQNGLLCSVDDTSLSASMYKIASKRELQIGLSANAPEVLTIYSEEKVLDIWDSLFESMGLLNRDNA